MRWRPGSDVQNRAIQRDTSIAGDLPPVLGQPDRVRAVAAADVERSAGGSSVTSATSAPLAKRLR
jgi:hypothetical protein